PLRSWSQKEKPPALPRPGIAGGGNPKATASGTPMANAPFNFFKRPAACNSGFFRSPQSLSWTKKKALYGAETRESRLKPTTVGVDWIPSVFARMSSILRQTGGGGWSEAPPG